jgi:hypothetical protein
VFIMGAVLRVAAAAFLVWHGVVHIVMWGMYRSESWSPRHSWLVDDARLLSIAISSAAAALFVAAGLALAADRVWWPYPAVAAAVLSIILMILTFNVRWLLGIALDGAVIAFGIRALDP